ncbi:hypothetical protein [Roseibium algae]|uniref:Uncharacterized protein n=1 Tax=Roseibium algae TaxID=3123038 RepID=A0ABU8TR34_9HYPH
MNRNTSPPTEAQNDGQSEQMAIHFNWEDWLPYLETDEISEADKRQCIEALWAIIHTFIDLRISITSGSAKSEKDIDLTALFRGDLVQSSEVPDKENEHKKEEA